MIITIPAFHALYGPGRPPIKEAYWDKSVRCDIEVPLLTALADYYKCKRCLEIGCNTGATSAAMLAGSTIIKEYIGVDLNVIWFVNEPAGHFAISDPRFRLIQSAAGLYDLKPADIGQVDFVFIDADHSYQAIKHDTEFTRQVIGPAGGVIVWHDYQHPNCPDVRKYIHEINDRPGQPPIVWVQGTTVCYQIIAAPPAAMPGGTNEPKRHSRAKSAHPEATA